MLKKKYVVCEAILETSHRISNLDYDIFMKLTLTLCKDFIEVEKLYRMMCFNVFAHNRDDHSKIFFIYMMKGNRDGYYRLRMILLTAIR